MTQPTSAVSLRITEEDLALLDARVGMDGARNRSDVVRLAIQEFLHNQPLLADMKSIRILNRIVEWTRNGLWYEADQRHAEIFVKDLDLLNHKVRCEVPGERTAYEEEDEEALPEAFKYSRNVGRNTKVGAAKTDTRLGWVGGGVFFVFSSVFMLCSLWNPWLNLQKT